MLQKVTPFWLSMHLRVLLNLWRKRLAVFPLSRAAAMWICSKAWELPPTANRDTKMQSIKSRSSEPLKSTPVGKGLSFHGRTLRRAYDGIRGEAMKSAGGSGVEATLLLPPA